MQTAVIRVHRHSPAASQAGPALLLHIDGKPVEARPDATLLEAASAAGIYIPALCSHPDLPSDCQPESGAGCGLCLVEVEAEGGGAAAPQKSCALVVAAGLRVVSNSPAIHQARQEALAKLLEHHPHVCLTCPQRDGCSRVMCCFNNAVEERCCSIMSHCELRKVADYVIIPATTPEYDHQANRLPVVKDEPFYDRDYNLCIDCRRCLVACNEVRGVGCLEVKSTHGRSWVGPIADTLVESGCKFCNACVEVCPTGALLDRTIKPEQRDAEAAPCTTACPAGIDVPRYVQLAGLGKFSEANAVVREKLPFPGILGRACYSPCEAECRRGNLDDPLSIRSLKRIAADHDDGKWRAFARLSPPSGRRAAVIGAGPAGLTVAFYLAKQGHAVTVFEAMPEAGGMARYGIPAYRLPRAVIDNEVGEVAKLGVEFRFGARIDDLDALFAQGYEAVFIGIGAQRGARLDLPGEDIPGVVDGVGFLRDVAQGRIDALHGKVTIIGGGDVACDAARTALRLGEGEGEVEVELVYRRSQAEMPAHPSEIAGCLEEGVHPCFQSMPLEIKAGCGSPGIAAASPLQVTWARTQLSKPDVLGRRHLEKAPGSEFVSAADLVITAVGQQVEEISGFGLQRDADGRIQVRDDSFLTSRAGVYAGGDAVLGPTSLIDAVAQGRKAASAIDRFLGGDGDIEETLLDEEWREWHTDPQIGREDGFNQRRVEAPPRLPADARRNWDEVEQCHASASAQVEGQRCLKCNLMHGIGEAQLPPESWRPLEAVAVHAVTTESGVYLLHDAEKQVLAIKGVANLRNGLLEALEQTEDEPPLFFTVEPAHFFSQRESQLIQSYSEQHGRMPPGIGDDALDELF